MHSSELISLWVGSSSQSLAHHFFRLQSEQFFDEEEDPINHQSLWRDQKLKVPRTLIFDRDLPNLTRIREFDRTKIINKMTE